MTRHADYDRTRQLIEGFWSAQVINAAAELRIADVLAAGPLDVKAIATAADAHAPSVLRLMRALTALGLCKQCDASTFELTGAGEALRSDVPDSLRGRAMHVGGALWRAFADLPAVVRSGQPMPSLLTGPAGFEAMRRDPARLDAFQMSMAESSRRAAVDVLAAYDFGRFKHVMDVGGGYGALLSAILAAHPELTGAIYDLAYLSAGAQRYLDKAGVADRARFIGGDFFREVPEGADCYLLKFIIHDWGDEPALQILKHCRQASGKRGLILIVERIVPDLIEESRAHGEVVRGDLTMLAHGGMERTSGEYGDLLSRAGLAITSIVPTAGAFSVIEAAAR